MNDDSNDRFMAVEQKLTKLMKYLDNNPGGYLL